MLNTNTINFLEGLGIGADVDSLETYVALCQESHSLGNPLVEDSQYDALFNILKQLKPTSYVLLRNWETDDEPLESYDSMLRKYGMCSIETVKDIDEAVNKLKPAVAECGGPVKLTASLKLNGHGVRAVYEYGELVGASTRGRYKKGRDIYDHAKVLLPNHVERWKDISLLEVRGEALVSIDTFDRVLKGKLKTPLSSVTSLIRASAQPDEIALMDMVCYRILVNRDELYLEGLSDELHELGEAGIKIPSFGSVSGITVYNLEQALEYLLRQFENIMETRGFEYDSDGIVVTIDSSDLFYSLGKEGNSYRGNMAMKMGQYWESNIYSGIITNVEFVPGKTYMTPKAHIEPVTCSSGASVDVVPLYNVGVMNRYGYVPGAVVYFRFGGETGVTLCDVHGQSVRD